MNHFHIMSRTRFSDPIAARFPFDLSRSFLEDFLDMVPSSRGTTRHKRRTIAGAFLTAGDSRADEEQALGFQLLRTSYGIRVVRITTIDDDIALRQMGFELVDEVINSRSCLDKKNYLAGFSELGDQFCNRMGTLNVRSYRRRVRWKDQAWRSSRKITFGLILKEMVDFAGRAVVTNHLKTFVIHIQNQILALNKCVKWNLYSR